MSDGKTILVVDDAHMVGVSIRAYLAESTDPTAKDWLVEWVPTSEDVEDYATDPATTIDLALVDLVLDELDPNPDGPSRGGLSAIALLQRHRPNVPVMIHSAVEKNSDRFLYSLTALNWFDNVVGFLPKVHNPGVRNVGQLVIDSLTSAIAGTHIDPVIEMARENVAGLNGILNSRADLERWRAIVSTSTREAAAARLGLSTEMVRRWCVRVVDSLELMWNDAVDVGIARERDRFGRDGEAKRRQPYDRVSHFANLFPSSSTTTTSTLASHPSRPDPAG